MSAPELVTVSAGIISINGQPFMQWPNSNVAGIFLMRLGYKLTDAATYSFSK